MTILKPITPNETPKDTLLLVWSREGFSVASYDSKNAEWYVESEGKLASDVDGKLLKADPSHWMPLPELPHG